MIFLGSLEQPCRPIPQTTSEVDPATEVSHLLWLVLIVWYQGHGSSILCCQWGALGDSQLNELLEQLVAVSLLGEDHREAVCSSFTSCWALEENQFWAWPLHSMTLYDMSDISCFGSVELEYLVVRDIAHSGLGQLKCRIPAWPMPVDHLKDQLHSPRRAARCAPPIEPRSPSASCKMRRRPGGCQHQILWQFLLQTAGQLSSSFTTCFTTCFADCRVIVYS